MLSIFLSHSHKDKPFARELAQQLRSHGIVVWIDEAEMQVGDSLIDKIENAIQDCTYLGVILSPSSANSLWVQREINMALTDEICGRKVKVLPFLYKQCEIPGFLKDKLYADFTEDFDTGFSALIGRLNNDLTEESYRQKRIYEKLQSGYQDWVAFSKQDCYLLDRPAIEAVFQYVSEPSLSIDIVEYLVASVALLLSADRAPLNIEPLQKWSKGRETLLFDRLLAHPSPKVRSGSLLVIGHFKLENVNELVLRAVCEERDSEVRRVALRTSSHLRVQLPETVALDILKHNKDWELQSYALYSLPDRKGCFFVSDGTDFAHGIRRILDDSGFHTVTLSATFGSAYEINGVQEVVLQAHPLVVIVRGEHYAQIGLEKFYAQLSNFVAAGGILFATSWTSWETTQHAEFAQVLPFSHVADSVNEDVYVTCKPTGHDFARQLLNEQISFRTSFELLEAKRNTTLLLETTDSVPILGYRPFGAGTCYYFNSCQHTCAGKMASPLDTNPQLFGVIQRLMAKIFSDINQ